MDLWSLLMKVIEKLPEPDRWVVNTVWLLLACVLAVAVLARMSC